MKPKTYNTEELTQYKAIDTTPRIISSGDVIYFHCYLCGHHGRKNISEAVKTFKKKGFAYQCADCLKNKLNNRGDAWKENIKKACQSHAHKERAKTNSLKSRLKYTKDMILEVINKSGVTYEGDISSPNNTIKILWPDGVSRSIRIRKFMLDGLITRPKIKEESTNHLKFLAKIEELGVSITVLTNDTAELEYKGQKWNQSWKVNHLNKSSIRKIKNIDRGIKLQELLNNGITLNQACKEVGVDPNRYYRDRRAGVDIMTTAISTKEFQRHIQIDGAVYDKKLEPLSYRPDILVEDKKLIIEVDGMWSHSEEFKQKNYHITRWHEFRKLGYSVLSFSEMEVKEKRNIVDSMINHKLGKSIIIYARKCEIVELPPKEANIFFNSCHLKGSGQGKCLALKNGGRVVCALRFVHDDEKTINISRFCNNIGLSVVGGYSRLLAQLPRDRDIINFVDHRHGNGEGLLSLGFTKTKVHIGFEWTDGYNNFNRRSFLGNSGYENGLKKFWDYGQSKYIRGALQ